MKTSNLENLLAENYDITAGGLDVNQEETLQGVVDDILEYLNGDYYDAKVTEKFTVTSIEENQWGTIKVTVAGSYQPVVEGELQAEEDETHIIIAEPKED